MHLTITQGGNECGLQLVTKCSKKFTLPALPAFFGKSDFGMIARAQHRAYGGAPLGGNRLEAHVERLAVGEP